MRFLVDAQLPPRLATWLTVEGHEALHVAALPGGLQMAERIGNATRQEKSRVDRIPRSTQLPAPLTPVMPPGSPREAPRWLVRQYVSLQRLTVLVNENGAIGELDLDPKVVSGRRPSPTPQPPPIQLEPIQPHWLKTAARVTVVVAFVGTIVAIPLLGLAGSIHLLIEIIKEIWSILA